jgi:hypothetical protein
MNMNAALLVFFLLTGAEPAAGGKKNEKDNDRSKSEKKPMRYHRLVDITADSARHVGAISFVFRIALLHSFDFESSVVEVAEIRARTW